jgi:protein-glucosylgalactosylhydroxylysine glucosidase
MPTLSNGHIGFTVLSNEVFMNGLYNGKAGLSHRAKIPNFVNIIFEDCLNGPNNKTSCNFSLNMHHGFFMTKLVVADQFIATHMVYPHRYRNRLFINQIYIHRLNSKG